MKNVFYKLILLIFTVLTGCEQNLTLDLPEGQEQLVVEGHIEQDAPPVLILTRTTPVFSAFNAEELAGNFVHNANIVVSTQGRDYTLQEVPSPAFSEAMRQAVSAQLSIPEQLLISGSGFVVYVYTSDELKGKLGETYKLRISHEGRTLTASTTIPQLNPIDSLWTVPHPDAAQDSLVTLYYRYNDPDTLGNSIRYFTKRNSEPYYPGYFTSVFNDELINGGTISFPLERGEPKGQAELDQDKYGYFGKGDTITVRWAAIDIAHFRFWSSLEAEQSNNGSPVGSPGAVQSNISGGYGIWGGYAVTYHTLVVQ
ncbi:DUF4249 domain-containing protein [Pontibacter sp. 172403-2]|uniref:DUF4249 domain-containing protein n=1 Tax=Pontibacter rufus TaxID=2791028 RepID=UPI001E33D279|nr:DUF4249 domain-containing protein [Pontibacter sp. 172403-2]